MGAAALLLVLVASLGILTTPAPKQQEAPFDILMPQAGPLAHDPLDSGGEAFTAQ
jgi:hypothetical protein